MRFSYSACININNKSETKTLFHDIITYTHQKKQTNKSAFRVAMNQSEVKKTFKDF